MKSTTLEVINIIKCSSSFIWRIISDVGGVQHWMPDVQDCTLQGRGVGAIRICTTPHGQLIELIDRIDHVEQIFEYKVYEQSIFPFEDFKGFIQIINMGKGQTKVIWRLNFIVDQTKEMEIKKNLSGLIHQGIEGLARLRSAA